MCACVHVRVSTQAGVMSVFVFADMLELRQEL